MSFVIFDTEYTSWKGCLENGWTGNKKREIVQIAAVKVSDDLEVSAEFMALCKPLINPVLSDYFVNLTNITNEQIKNRGESFSKIYQQFEKFVEQDICYSHGWGSDYYNKSDGLIIEENLRIHNLFPEKKIAFRNIAEIFKQLYQENNIKIDSQSSGQIASILGLENNLLNMNLNQHNAYYDVYSILEGLRYFHPKSVKLLHCLENK